MERRIDERTRQAVYDRFRATLKPDRSGKGYICPKCGSGDGKKGTGISENPKSRNHFTCWAGCYINADAFDITAAIEGLTPGSGEAIRRTLEIYGVEAPRSDFKPMECKYTTKATNAAQKPPEATAEDYTSKYEEWHKALMADGEALAYLEGRGITPETAELFNLGYCKEWSHPKAPQYKSKRIIIPRSSTGYTARSIDGEERFKYQVVGTQGDLFHTDAFVEDEEWGKFPVAVVEGEIDAIAIFQGGYHRVIGLGSAGNHRTFAEQAAKRNPAATYLLALDNDPENEKGKKPGQEAQEALCKDLEAAGIDYISADTAALYGDYKDAAAAVKADTEGTTFWPLFMEYAKQGYYQRQAREQKAELEAYYRSGPGMVDTFLQAVKGEKYKPIPTGISTIDRALSGGLVRQTIVMLGAAPGMGKTALAAQIGESMARTGAADVLYINLEMSREQLLARSLARIAYTNGNRSISTTEILQGYRWTIETEEAVMDAAEQYKATIAQHLLYNPGEDTTDLDAIMGKIQAEQVRLGHAPVVVLDYLQLLTGPAGEDSVTTIKRAVQRLKEYAIKNDTIVIIITANNRDSMRTGDAGLNSGRDTSNIEYGADVHLGLVYKAVDDPDKERRKSLDEIRAIKAAYFDNPSDWTAEAEYNEYCTAYALKVNKNRHGADGKRAYLHFNGECAMFTPLDTTHEE